MLQKTILFLSSYSPVFALLIFQVDWSCWWIVGIFLVLLLSAGLLGLISILTLTNKKPSKQVVLVEHEDAGVESVAFLAGYLLPLLTATLTSWYAVMATVTYLTLAFVITVRTSLIQVNPILLLLGYRISRANFRAVEEPGASNIGSGYFLARPALRAGDVVEARRVGDDVFLVQLPRQN